MPPRSPPLAVFTHLQVRESLRVPHRRISRMIRFDLDEVMAWAKRWSQDAKNLGIHTRDPATEYRTLQQAIRIGGMIVTMVDRLWDGDRKVRDVNLAGSSFPTAVPTSGCRHVQAPIVWRNERLEVVERLAARERRAFQQDAARA